jgi:hypothetical protein
LCKTDVSEELIASIFRVEEKINNPRGRNQREEVAADRSLQSIRRHMPEDGIFYGIIVIPF